MARFLVKASEFKNVCKAVNDRKLAELKKEIIEILKKQDSKEFKKATDYLNSQEEHYTHLEKSLNGKWIEKAGYGIGTVRIWKGKKYKKIAPGKWARVFDKEGRGANVSIGRLIAEVDKIQTIEKLYEFAMAHKQRFVDDNGIDLPILDKLRAKVDSKNNELSNGGMGSKGTSKPVEKKKDENVEKFPDKTLESKKKQLEKLKSRLSDLESKDVELTTRSQGNWGDGMRLSKLPSSKEWENNREKIEGVKAKIEILKREIREEEEKPYWIQDIKGNRLTNEDAKEKIKVNLKKIDELSKGDETRKDIKIRDMKNENDYLMERLNQNDKRDMEIEAKFYESEESEAENKTAEYKKEYEESIKNEVNKFAEMLKEEDISSKEELESMKKVQEIRIKSEKENEESDGSKGRIRIAEEKIKFINQRIKELEEKDNEAEKTKNRSDAMKGNQNAKKYGLTDDQIERYDIQEVVEDINGYGIVKNNEGKYSFIEDGRVRDRPDDFETSIEKVKERINDSYETKKNIEAANNYSFKDADFGKDVIYKKLSNGKHEYYKKTPEGKVISVKIEISDMREPLNMTYEVTDVKTGESWQYETAYGNKEKLEWAVERPEQMEKELKKFFKRDPNKEWDKMNTSDEINNFESEGKVVSYDDLQPIATNKSVGENEVQLPYSKDLANEIESLKDCVVLKWDSREFMKHVYYEDGKLITTDARRMKFIEVGELEGIPDGSYVDITTDKSGINIKKLEGMDSYKFPNYKRVIPEDLNQKATLDTKLVKNKIKEMQKDGAISRKGTNVVQLEFRDGKVFIDDTPVGEAKNISMKYSDDWGPARNETNFMAINADYLVNALSGKTSVLQIGERADKAVMINTGSSSNILMPMSGSDKKMDYGQGRQAKKDANEKKSALKEAYKKTNEEYIASIKANYGERFKRMAQSAADNLTERMADMSDETLKLNYDRLKFNLDKVMDKKEYITEDTKVDNKLKLGLRDAILYQTTAKEHPEVIERFEEELEKRGISVKKSLFDDFVMDMFVDEDEEEIEEDKENESLFNDYSAEQPELFNSTELMVSEAMNRHFCNCL